MRSRKPPEIPQDLPFHRRLWVAQRIGWAAGLLLIALALGGLFGDGPLSHVRTGDAVLSAEYDRFLRRDSAFEIHIDAQPSARGEVRVSFSADYLSGLRIDSIVPYPQRTETTTEGIVFVFRVPPPTAVARITINATPLNMGSLQGHVRLTGGTTSVPLDQFVWP